MKTRDVAKIGNVFLNGGMWNGQRIVPEGWLEESTRMHIRPTRYNQLGYLWWRSSLVIRGKKIDSFYGAGYGGQSLTIIPDLDLIIVFTCWTRAEDAAIFCNCPP